MLLALGKDDTVLILLVLAVGIDHRVFVKCLDISLCLSLSAICDYLFEFKGESSKCAKSPLVS
jgi:hypothetical protein